MKKLLISVYCCAIILFLMPVISLAVDFYVATTGDDTNDCLGTGSPCLTIGGAITKAANNDTINIADGTYSENLTIDKDLTLLGGTTATTIIDGGASDRVVYAGTGRVISLEKMTIQNGSVGTGEYGAGVLNGGTLIIEEVVLSGNQGDKGAAISNIGGILTLRESLITENISSTSMGSVINNQSSGSVTMTNVTVSNNTGEYIISTGITDSFTMVNSTIVNNSGVIYDSGSMSCKNTIIANNNGGTRNCQVGTGLTSLGNNLEDLNTCTLNDASDQVNTDPKLQALAGNGGSTWTHALQLTSPAVDSGTDTGCPSTDQRGVSRPKDGDQDSTATCDIGAYELDVTGLSGVILSGPSSGKTTSLYVFEATGAPIEATQPIEYAWTADGQSKIVHSQGGITDAVAYTWALNESGTKNITVTADNGFTQRSDTMTITLSQGKTNINGVSLTGPSTGSNGQDYTFTATVVPDDASVPITYTWKVDGQQALIHSDMIAVSDQASFSFDTDGPHTISVTASNGSSASSSHIITTSAWYVNQATGSDANDCLSTSTPCQSIEGAVTKAGDKHTIIISAGTYQENISISDDLTLIGAGQGSTVVDGQALYSVLNVNFDSEVIVQKMTLQNGSFTHGAGVSNSGILTLEEVEVKDNTATNFGGGIYCVSNGSLTLRNSTISGNQSPAGAALYVSGPVTVENTTISANTAGGSVSDSVLYTHPLGSLSLTNVTVSNNSQGLALDNSGTTTMLNTTIADNSGGLENNGTVTLKNSILANNNSGTNCLSPLTSQGNNLDSGNSCGLNAGGDLINTDPLLKPLGNYGGMTLTHALSRYSPALDTGTNTGCPTVDQRGESRPFDDNYDGTATCDMGAVEMHLEKHFPWNLFLPTFTKKKN